MNIVMVGTGYVGLISGLCFAEFGFKVTFVDKDNNRIKKLNQGLMPIYEPGLDELFAKHQKNTKQIKLSNDITKSLSNADAVFITVGTPSRRIDDDADLTSVYAVAEEISHNIKKYCLVVIKSTVPVGTSRKIKEIIQKKVNNSMFDVASNPEFLREGSAINDFMRPDRVIIGIESDKGEKILKSLYRPLYILETPIVITNLETAELIKYASNSFLATKISFINEVADLCEKVGANIQDVSKGMGLDKRINSKFLHAGPGFGGSCFPKDVKAFSNTAKKNNIKLSIVDSVNEFNKQRPKILAKKIEKFFSNNVNNLKFALLGLSFKPNTDDIRDSTSIIIGNELLQSGAKIIAYDPKAMKNSQYENPKFKYGSDVYDTCNNVDAIIIGTEWNEFRALDLKKLKTLVNKTIIFDLRNLYNQDELKNLGWEHISIGR
ncbi:MAG: UDP-glucose 6-dehydrogenase [Alphaproteobacteria bacterium MarineAlpha5_Bin12]|nr:UDP-glucose 6-dehydrogenase [Pelagibacteraceae bacterium]PPR42002.1 MAG: UDP-glucose 6-dehydrogenase [Alphaproteobacteria bacterium MarineAlpha5_Bin12]|tara:strand:- start:7086 stop:8390 length:1305 start_codon:yes stop_codon:yes gene_type:complete